MGMNPSLEYIIQINSLDHSSKTPFKSINSSTQFTIMVAIKISALALFVSMITLSSATPIDSEAQTLEARARGNAVVYTSVGPSCDQVVERQAFQGDNVHICHEVTNIGSLRVEGR
jgi:hypothetical protein